MTRVFFPIGTYYPAKVGGPTKVIYDFVNALNVNGICTTVVTSRKGIIEGEVDFDQEIKSDNNVLIYFNKLDFGVVKYIYKSIKEADVIHLTSLFDKYSIICFFILFLKFRSKRVFWSPRGELNKNALSFGKLKKRILISFYKTILGNFKRLTFHSTSKLETIDIKNALSPSSIVEIPNIFNFPIVNRYKKKKQMAFVGRIHPIKSLDLLIDAISCSTLFKKMRYKLFIAGYYELENEDYYIKLINKVSKLDLSENIELIGHISGEEKRSLFGESELTFLISKSENFGNVVVESLYEGTPVVTSHGTPWELLEDMKCGYWVSADKYSIASAIDSFLSLSDGEKIAFYENSRMFAMENFGMQSNINKWINLYV